MKVQKSNMVLLVLAYDNLAVEYLLNIILIELFWK
jgi:hypothetical protein